MNLRRLFNVLKLAFQDWGEDRASVLGAALAYYTIFSIGPLLVAVIGIVGLILGPDAASGRVSASLEQYLGEGGADAVEAIIAGASKPTEGVIATVIGAIGVVFGAIAIFGQLKNALNVIWEAPKRKGGIGDTILANVAMFGLVLGAGLVMLLSLAATTIISSIEKMVGPVMPGGPIVWQILNFVVSLGLITVVFAMIFKVLPDVSIAWKDVWLGSFITAILFLLGQILIGIYVGVTNVGSSFGAASSLVAILVWIYFSAQIMFLGAEITQVYANTYGSKIGEKKRFALRLPRRDRKDAAGVGEGEEKPAPRVSPWFSR